MIYVVPTIDTEGVHGERPWDLMALGDLGSRGIWGAERLAAIFQRFGVSATFFVDVYEHSFFGERVADLCTSLARLDQDVQLHTHPSWRDDPRDSPAIRQMKREQSFGPQAGDFMAKLTYARQLEVLEHGVGYFERVLGWRPTVHRSGGYSINDDTVRALAAAGIRSDSSMYRTHPHSHVSWTANAIVDRDGIIEQPVTVLDYAFRVPPVRAGVDVYRRTIKTDLDTCTLDELLWFVDASAEAGFAYMNLFMHSYSLIDFDGFYRRFDPEPGDADKLEALLARLCARSDVRVISASALADAVDADPSLARRPDAIPRLPANGHIARLGLGRIRNRIIDFCTT